MFDIIHKTEYFRWCKQELVPRQHHQLKVTQDAWVLSMIRSRRGQRFAEVGGGDSRVVRRLKKHNECWIVDKFEGLGQGPQAPPAVEGVNVVTAYLGDFDPRLPDAHFDVVFSISVVEHVPTERLPDFFRDCARILKPGGLLLHAIDLYVFDKPRKFERVEAYRKVHTRAGLPLEWIEPPRLKRRVSFSCAYASNPDSTLYRWNELTPELRETREIAQSVSIKAGWRKRGGPDS